MKEDVQKPGFRMKRIAAILILFLILPYPAVAAERVPPEISAARTALQNANTQLQIALQEAERSLGPHTPGSGWTKSHMQTVINVVEGRAGKDFNEKVETPGDGNGVLRYLEEARTALNGSESLSSLSAGAVEAIHYAQADLNEAVFHAKGSLKGNGMVEIHAHAGLASGLLAAARGLSDRDSPATGTLTYALRALFGSPGAGPPR